MVEGINVKLDLKQTLDEINITDNVIIIRLNDERYEKASFPMIWSSEFGRKVTVLRFLHSWNAQSSILLTFGGIDIIWIDEPKNAFFSIDLIDDGIETFVKDEQLQNVLFPIEVNWDGIVICFNDEHVLNAEFPIDVNDEGISIASKDLQL